MKYLSELFLETIREDYTPASIQHAMEVCNREYIFRENEISSTELRDYYDVVKEFIDFKTA